MPLYYKGKHKNCGGDVYYIHTPGSGELRCFVCGQSSHRRWNGNPPLAPEVEPDKPLDSNTERGN